MQIEKWNRTTTLQPEKPEVILLDDAFSTERLRQDFIFY
jgi:tetraacyldisaccharide-1-P 4'-kinase